MEKPKFWCVWSPRGKAPKYRHETLAGAQAEAERLSALHIGRHFYVLEMVSYAITGEPTLTDKQQARLNASLTP